MSIWEWLGFVSGVLGVILTIRQHILCWPLAIVSVAVYTYVFFVSGLYGDMALQLFYLGSSIYGWWLWAKGKGMQEFVVFKMSEKIMLISVGLTAVLTVLFYFILKQTNTNVAFYDAFLTAVSLVTTWLMAKKYLENWIIWVFADCAYVFLYVFKELYLTAILYLIFAVLAALGYFQWKKKIT